MSGFLSIIAFLEGMGYRETWDLSIVREAILYLECVFS